MALNSEFVELPLERLHSEAAIMKGEGWRFIQTHAVNTDDGVDLYYSFMKEDAIRNYRVAGVTGDKPVPSITDLFLAAFVFENETRELFGVDMRDIAIDFAGSMYAPSVENPMTIISPEQKAAREKARKVAAAKAAKAQGAESAPKAQETSQAGFVMTPERQARLDAKMATMSPEKQEKVRAALEAIKANATAAPAQPATADKQEPAANESGKAATPEEPKDAAPSIDEELEAKLAIMDPAKADKVRSALNGQSEQMATDEPESAEAPIDEELAAKLAVMDPQKAEKVRAALKGGK